MLYIATYTLLKRVHTFSIYYDHINTRNDSDRKASKPPNLILLALSEVFSALLQALLCAAKSTIVDLQVINLLLCGENSAVATILLALPPVVFAIIITRAAA